ncbi:MULTISPECIES: Na+/H+ antiporter subunit E [unclassified Arthrobacter]|uniref:Na+/H+ antiporter subunit E n=1 Tax=unclassified Arthrobacter TaxID=235627 RepID=UPI001E52660F|nr:MULTISPECIES: Na+/H+ antiporter subunit E [unclassified Arthrobacter]MCC9144663.1 Na+/H+ antiporter subunit E [Arthrobacter sp. zg-Y919]MDK1275889.1 Na+/H+ antiporter subunit E [Arthrobacter sp. zg.Y919]MDM7990252.1 Na+/H+ antiporter subunit E [Arthrobacter sp. zg-Y877]WIB02753.1 Na+/H+ antiporter subunit E [Arthrobacter sp. zg-Y919]
MTKEARMRNRPRVPLLQELPLLIWLVFLWGALWQDFSAGNLIFGAAIALIVANIFYLPPVELSGRFNPLYAAVFAGRFIWKLVQASFHVFWLAVVRGPRIRNGVIGVKLRSRSDLLTTATGHALSLIPGSLIVEVDRSTSTLYLHALNVSTPEQAEKVREDVLNAEAWLIRTMGTKEELAALRAETAETRKQKIGGWA